MSFIYLDNNATTPLLPEVADAMHEIMGISFFIANKGNLRLDAMVLQ